MQVGRGRETLSGPLIISTGTILARMHKGHLHIGRRDRTPGLLLVRGAGSGVAAGDAMREVRVMSKWAGQTPSGAWSSGGTGHAVATGRWGVSGLAGPEGEACIQSGHQGQKRCSYAGACRYLQRKFDEGGAAAVEKVGWRPVQGPEPPISVQYRSVIALRTCAQSDKPPAWLLA